MEVRLGAAAGIRFRNLPYAAPIVREPAIVDEVGPAATIKTPGGATVAVSGRELPEGRSRAVGLTKVLSRDDDTHREYGYREEKNTEIRGHEAGI